MEKGPLIGTGRTAEIFAWGDDRVLKLFMDWCPHSWIESEERLSRVVYESGLSVPAVEGIIEVDGRKGIIFERVEGGSMVDEMLSNQKRVLQNDETLAELHNSIHSRKIPEIPSLRDMIEHDIQRSKILTEQNQMKALQVLKQIKDGTTLCHFDYHPLNIIMSPRGPVIIDWMTARKGNLHADIARTLLILKSSLYTTPSERHTTLKSFIDRYLSRYSEIRDISLVEIEAWRLPLAAARLNENIPHEREWLKSIINTQ
jgi:tRNA A-37 threonylcarbamoyl transferase component Bud32